MKRAWLVALATVLGLVLVPGTAAAATFTVNTTGDTPPATAGCAGAPGDCSLRQAIESANANSGDDTINFSIPGGSTITLSQGPLTINPAASSADATAINGPGASQLTIAQTAGNGDEVFHFTRGNNTLTGVTVTGGEETSFNGAGINKRGGTLTLTDSIVTGNHNDAQNFQGAGGVLNVSGMMTIRSSTISNNVVDNADSGGGAGVVSHPGDILIVNTTISGNRVNGSGSNTGGGIWNAQGGGTMTLVNVTVSNNTSESGPGGLENEGEGDVNLANTILAGNNGPNSPDCQTFFLSSTTSQGYNLIGSGDGCGLTPATGDKVGNNGSRIDPKLGGLANNGGATPTQALIAGSPAIDGGNPASVSDTEPPADPPALVACRTTDQRGIVRPQLAACDIGAYEYAPGVASASAPPCSQNGLVTVSVTPPQGGFSQAVHYQIDGGPEQRAPTQNNQVTVLIPQGAHNLTYWAESQGGDQELTEHNLNLRVDSSPPVVRIRSDQRRVTYRKGQFASVTITASDSSSPLTRNPSRRRLRISTARLGRRTIRATATDTCLNSATRTFTYRVIAAARRPARRGGGRPRFTG
jgi:CSLREA domain-containing protein